MNYRHSYHAGNFADVMKHVVLSLVIQHYKQKPAPFRFIDTHSGAGAYDLAAEPSERTSEWRDGIGKLLAANIDEEAAKILNPYLTAIGAAESAPAAPFVYPGSPLLARRLMRTSDHVIANELHPEDQVHLRVTLRGQPNTKVMALDGWTVLKAVVPPKERRGIILIDPPFEKPDEYGRLITAVENGLERFATGTYLLWYPLKDAPVVAQFEKQLANLGMKKLDIYALGVSAQLEHPGLTASSIAIINPPYTLHQECRTIFPVLAKAMAKTTKSWFQVRQVTAQ